MEGRGRLPCLPVLSFFFYINKSKIAARGPRLLGMFFLGMYLFYAGRHGGLPLHVAPAF